MPQAILAAALTTGAGVAFGNIVASEAMVFFFKSLVVNVLAQEISQALSKDQGFSAEARGRAIMFRSPAAPHQVIYGSAVVSGPLVFGAITGSDNRYLHLVIPIAGHQIEAIDEILLNDKPLSDFDQFDHTHEVRLDTRAGSTFTVTLDGNVFSNATAGGLASDIGAHASYTTSTQSYYYGSGEAALTGLYILVKAVTSGVDIVTAAGAGIFATKVITQGDKAVRINTHLGDANQAADTNLVAEVSEWTTEHRGRGIAYIYARFRFNPKAWPTGVPNIKARIRGKNDIYDPRDLSTGYSNNWALCVANYLQWKNGFNSDATEVEQAKVITAANICDEQVEYQSTLFQNRYEINGAFTLDKSPIAVLTDLQSAGAGTSVFQMGQWHVYAGAATAADPRTLGEDDLRGPIKYRAKTNRQNLFNAVRGTFINRDEHYQQTDFPPITNATYETEDGNERIYADIALPYTDDVYAAQRLAKVKLENHRQPIVVEFPAKIIGLKFAIWDVVPVTIAALGWTDKLFRVMDWQLAGPGGPDLVLKEYAATAWDWNFGEATVVDPAPDTSLPSPGVVNAPSGMYLNSGTSYLLRGNDGTITSRIYADWVGNDAYFSHFEVQFKKSANTVWLPAGITTDQFMAFGPVDDGVLYDVRVRTVNTLQQKSAWHSVPNHLVLGEKENPPDVDSYFVERLPDGTREFEWTFSNQPADHAGFKIKARLGTGWSWADLNDLHTGLLLSSPWETNQLVGGTYTSGIVAVDRKGNESLNPVIIQSDLGPPRIKNALVVDNLVRDGWPGTKTSCSVDPLLGYLLPDALDTWADLPTTWSAWTTWNMNPVASMVYTHPVIDVGAIIPFTPLVSTSGSGTILIEERHSDDNVLYTSWVTVTGQVIARYIEIRITVTTPDEAGLTSGQIILDADEVIQEDIDLDTSTIGNGSTGDRRLPLIETFNVITRVGLVLQNVGGGWTWDIVDKDNTNGPRFRIYNNGVLADAVIDAEIKGA